MTTFQEYALELPPGHTYALAIPEASYSPYQGDLTDAKDFYLYSLAVEDRRINNTAESWTSSDAGENEIYLLPAALSYLAAAAKEGGHIIIDVAVPDWTSIAYESLPFLYINNDKMMLQRQRSGRIQLAVGGDEGGVFDLGLDLRSGDSEVGKSGVFRITGSMVIRNYTYLEPLFIHRISIQRRFTEQIDKIFVAEVFEKTVDGETLGNENSAMRQVLASLAAKWSHGHKERGYNIAAALADGSDKTFKLALFVLNEKKRSRIAHAETRVVSFMNVVCRQGTWEEDSAVVKYITKLSDLQAKQVLDVRSRFLEKEEGGSKLLFLSSFQPCYMCRAEPDGAVLDRISSVNGTAIAPDGRSLRSSFGGKYLDRLEMVLYFDMDANVFYPRVVKDAISGEQGPAKAVSLVQTSTDGFVSPQGQPIFGPVAIGNAKEDYGTDVAYRRITNSTCVPVVDNDDGVLSLRLETEEGLDYDDLLLPKEPLPVGMQVTLAGSGLAQAGAGGANPVESTTGKAGAHSQGFLISAEQLAALRRVAILLDTLR